MVILVLRRRRPPTIVVNVFFARRGRRPVRAFGFRATPEAVLYDALMMARVGLKWEHPDWPEEFVTEVKYRRNILRASRDPESGEYVYGIGTEQITFAINGEEFEDESIRFRKLPARGTCKLLIALEQVTRVENSVLPFVGDVPGEMVVQGAA